MKVKDAVAAGWPPTGGVNTVFPLDRIGSLLITRVRRIPQRPGTPEHVELTIDDRGRKHTVAVIPKAEVPAGRLMEALSQAGGVSVDQAGELNLPESDT